MTTQLKNRKTGKVKKIEKPEEEHLRHELPGIRIVSDELWEAVESRLQAFEDKQAIRREGGYNRAGDAIYPYSGLLLCGYCGQRLRVGGIQGKGRYECTDHRRGGGCTNAIRIPAYALVEQLNSALVRQLCVSDTMTYFSKVVFSELHAALESNSKSGALGSEQDLKDTLRLCEKKIKNTTEGIIDTGSEHLKSRLVELEVEHKRIENELKRVRAAMNTNITEQELSALIERNVTNIRQVLECDPVLARQIIQKHVKQLHLYPREVDGKIVCEVIGELDIFTYLKGVNNGVLLGVSGTLNSQQHTVDSTFRFALSLEVTYKDKCMILDPLSKLLAARPELSETPRMPTEWGQLLNEFFGYAPGSKGSFKYGKIARAYWYYHEEMSERLVMSKHPHPTPSNPGHVYRFALRDSVSSGPGSASTEPSNQPSDAA